MNKCSTPQDSARLCVLGTGRECGRWIGSLKGGCVFCNFQPLDWEHTHTHARTHLIEGNYFHVPTTWWLSLLAGWRLWPSSGDPAGSLWGGHEIRSPLRQWQRHPQVRDVCSDSAAEPRLRKLQVRLYRGGASCRVSVAQETQWEFDCHPFIPIHVGFLPQAGRPALDQEVKISPEMEGTMIFISDTESAAATLNFPLCLLCMASLEDGRWKGKRPGMSKRQKKSIK